MDDVAATLDEMEEAGEDISTFQTYYFGYAEVVSLDPTGRMVLSKRLREKAGIDQAVSYMGLGKTFRLSSPDAPEAATDPLSRVVETLPDDVSIPKLLAQSRRRLREGS
jgi:MraZ protein